MSKNETRTGPAAQAASQAAGQDGTWPPHFPHSEIDRLIDDLHDVASARPEDAGQLLQLIAKEAQRLRTAVVRLSVARIREAECEAELILSAAHERVSVVRQLSLEALGSRLEEADDLMVAMRRAFLTEGRAALGSTRGSPDYTGLFGVPDDADTDADDYDDDEPTP
ncbi:hypothetical protein BJ980_001470 [Nocardioides daedukensis]|uniref:Uncharacterized protein n=1 Tax=Nocardioides daedukensis TaxID=634462 RepID=A0A7Y9S126_9ACTN|nr:hypothetical protein [Nocardioides daedukensis]NYG58547.1 hypothetical protein [Nocardioides daedukensis]